MSASLLDLIKAYGDARREEGDYQEGGWTEELRSAEQRTGVALTRVKARIEAIEDAAIQIGVDGETISALLDGRE